MATLTTTRGARVFVHAAASDSDKSKNGDPQLQESKDKRQAAADPKSPVAPVNHNAATRTPLAAERPWRPYPWNLVPDWFSAFLGLCIIGPIAPFMAVLIGSAELTWAMCTRAHKHLRLGFINRAVLAVAEKIGNVVLRDKRNFPYLPYIFFLTFWAPFLFYQAWQYNARHGFSWAAFFVYHFLRIGPRFRFFAHQHVLLHKEGHDYAGIFKGPMRALNYVCQWFIGPFYGQVPFSYAAAHNKIHHRYDNGLDDVHTNLDLDRTQPYSLLVYTPRFAAYWSGVSPLIFFFAKGESRLVRAMGAGMLYYYGLTAVLLAIDWKFCLGFWVFPLFESSVFFSAISYLWHAWMDPEDADNQYVNSMTILNGRDNIWNEDYHVVHHTAANVHWTDYPAHYERHIAEYKRSKATIFRDTEEGELLAWMLSCRWDKMVEHFVDLTGTMTNEDKLELIMSRLRATLSKAPKAS